MRPTIDDVIESILVDDDARMRDAFAVGRAAKSLDRPWFSPPGVEDWLVGRRRPDPGTQVIFRGWFDPVTGTQRGNAMAFVPLHDNLDKAYVDVVVHPDARRRGIGTALLRDMTQQVAALGRTTLLIDSFVPAGAGTQHPYLEFARANGCRRGWTEVVRQLSVPRPDGQLESLHGECLERMGSDYEVQTFIGRVPDERLPGLAELMRLLVVDAPSGDFDYEAETVTPEILRHVYDREAAQGRTRLSALVVYRPSGAVVAQSDLVVPAGADGVVTQEGTYVHREHCGHALGMAVKVANLEQLQRELAGARTVETMNAEDNAYMVGINVRLGFEPVEDLVEWILEA